MRSRFLVLLSVLFFAAACGDGGSNNADGGAGNGDGGTGDGDGGPGGDDGCPTYQKDCSGTCVITAVDRANCGDCGVTCNDGQAAPLSASAISRSATTAASTPTATASTAAAAPGMAGRPATRARAVSTAPA